ncbi:MAG: C2 family cysteine protease [Luteimonas sp.]
MRLDAASVATTAIDFARQFVDAPLDKQKGGADHTTTTEAGQDTPFATGPGDGNAVHPNDVRQNGYGSCAVLSSLVSIAQQDPGAIRDMIQDNGDGTYTVTFQEPIEIFGMQLGTREVEVTVSGPFEGGAAHPSGDVSAGGQQEVWPAIIEAAYAQQYHAHDPQYSTGVNPADVMERVLGVSAQSEDVGSVDFGTIERQLENGDAVVAWTSSTTDANGNSVFATPEQQAIADSYGVVPGHAYGVREVVRAGETYVDPNTGQEVTAAEDMIVLENPWGSNDAAMTFADYQAVYYQLNSAPTSP